MFFLRLVGDAVPWEPQADASLCLHVKTATQDSLCLIEWQNVFIKVEVCIKIYLKILDKVYIGRPLVEVVG